jgi:hypothetical protein
MRFFGQMSCFNVNFTIYSRGNTSILNFTCLATVVPHLNAVTILSAESFRRYKKNKIQQALFE